MPDLRRFADAQDDPHAGFAVALGEIRAGGKRSHWIWYVFPQIEGLGASGMSRRYAIAGLAEARAYLSDPDLRARLLAITAAVADQLRRGRPLAAVMGSEIDAAKLVSSLTLFGHAARTLGAEEKVDAHRELAALADEVLAAAAQQGYPPCRFTLDRLRAEE